jgi:pyrroloquinoline quinone (PQQ) biosynthesis protein C
MSEPSWKETLHRRARRGSLRWQRREGASASSQATTLVLGSAPAVDPAEVLLGGLAADVTPLAPAPVRSALAPEAPPAAPEPALVAPPELIAVVAPSAPPPPELEPITLAPPRPEGRAAIRPTLDLGAFVFPQAPRAPNVDVVVEPSRRSWPVPIAGPMGREALRDRLLSIMDRKDHWAWPYLTAPGLTGAQLHVHFRHEYLTYVRDFPVLLARILGKGPPPAVRRMLAENVYEEQTGGLSFGVSHPELFLEMMEGLGFDRRSFESPEPTLEPEAAHYRGLLEQVTTEAPWVVGAAVLGIFVEGSLHERAELEGRRLVPSAAQAVESHPLVRNYGCPPGRMRLVRAHRAVESGHRADAWAMVLDHAAESPTLAESVISAVDEAHLAWLAYRDGVARAMGLER